MTDIEKDDVPRPGIPVLPACDDAQEMDKGYAWVICFAVFIINGFVWGILASFGVYLSYYISVNKFPGATDLDFTFIGGTNFAVAMAVSPFVNIGIRKFGTKAVMYPGCFVFASGFICASFAIQFWQLILSQGILVGIGTGMIWLPAAPLLPSYFLRKRSLAQGIASAGSGIIGMAFSLATTPMINSLSLAWALRMTGILAFAALILATILIRDRHSTIRPKIRPFDTKILMRAQVLLLIGFTFFTIIGYIICLYSLSAFALSIGLSQRQGGIAVALVNAGSALFRIMQGFLSDRFGRVTISVAATAFNVMLVFAWWLPTTSLGSLLALSLVLGGTSGVFWSVIAPLCAEVVELGELPSTLCLVWLTVSMPSLFAEAIALEIRRPGSHMPFLYPQILTGLSFLVASFFLAELRRRKWGLFSREKN